MNYSKLRKLGNFSSIKSLNPLSIAIILILLFLFTPSISIAQEEEACIKCHEAITPGVITDWRNSKHSESEVVCSTCHTAKDGDPSGKTHNGFLITAIPSPRYCADCHLNEAEQY